MQGIEYCAPGSDDKILGTNPHGKHPRVVFKASSTFSTKRTLHIRHVQAEMTKS
jgi:hypothetical protein